MNRLPLEKLGAIESAPGIVTFGVFLPWISSESGNRLFIKIIHETDQFIKSIQPLAFELQHSADADYGDYWSLTLNFNNQHDSQPGSHFGALGRHVYRFELHNPNVGILDWIVDPYAREFATGKLSAFTLGYSPYQWSAAEADWKTPHLWDLILYEMNLAEFSDNVQGAIDHLNYLADLNVNAVSVMPVTNVSMEVDWGYLPFGYFGVDERFGRRGDFQRFVDAAHQLGLAVIVDAVYGHTAWDFTYADLYKRLQYHENPFMGPFVKEYFGANVDYNRKLAQDFFFTVNTHWLGTYHVDGFRYDCVPEFWDGALGVGYANLVFNTYQFVKNSLTSLSRFNGAEGVRLIQIAEQLEAPEQILAQTYSNGTWQNASLSAAADCAHGAAGAIGNLGLRLGAIGYANQVDTNGDILFKAPLQYLENHDHSRFLCEFGLVQPDSSKNPLFFEGDRENHWFKVQPYLIAFLTAKGIPMLWQGQEFGENYFLPDGGTGRVRLLRPVRWDYFYDDIGKSLVDLSRKLLTLRKGCPELRQGEHFFFNDYQHFLSHGLLLFQRSLGATTTLVAVNFTDYDQSAPFTFTKAGEYKEQLQNADNFTAHTGQERWLTIPSNYGKIWRVS